VIREPVRFTDKHHITGKPTAVMQQLVRVCPPGGIVLDPFAGSGTTGVAALLEGRRFVGIEITTVYAAIARERLQTTGANIALEDFRAGQEPLFGGLGT
jgi:site-specific DNA-methyltransferase (adenine-specific)